ncbi:MAG: 1-deoxy-D-xylulose-5-phosphate synthase [Oscillospiraceae bacterium]|nr:1-deoxy-D-xylulose-5-phosphate synthase [Oscillospiraceae bacterium]MBQ5489349.1 1-deoxy-D-xylulose-5-phosphate synthase [Oscillospiraceae bacterium]
MSVLDKINSSADVKKLDEKELTELCAEIRTFLTENVSKTGGHLASNLGAVELSVALHRVYDTSADRIVFDVGHQSYVHKILTGRKERFGTLRQLGGISGFPKPYESDDDAFIAGHASNSVAVALGMARARTMKGEKYKVACVIGDGSMTGGMATEAIANAAAANEPLVIILNDNNMSINRNVGGMARVFDRMRLKPAYFNFKRAYRQVFRNLPELYRFNHIIKENVKEHLVSDNIFSEMGMYYLGPVDGHNISKLESVLEYAVELDSTVLVHVITKKGKGVPYAENNPDKYHGVGKFDPLTGEMPCPGESFSSKAGEVLSSLADDNKDIVAITAAMTEGTGMDIFALKHPGRIFDVGIAEQTAVAMAAGMAKQGITPFVAIYSTFLQRAYDMLIHDIALQGLHVVFGVDRAGLVGADGETHQGTFDVAYLSSVPGMKIYSPANFAELEYTVRKAIYEDKGPVAVRYPRGGEGEWKELQTDEVAVIKEGTDFTLVSYGIMINNCLEAARLLEKNGVSAEVVKINVIKPLDYSVLDSSILKTGKLMTVEDVCTEGSAGEKIAEHIAVSDIKLSYLKLLDLGDGIVEHGSVAELQKKYGLDALSICTKFLEDNCLK